MPRTLNLTSSTKFQNTNSCKRCAIRISLFKEAENEMILPGKAILWCIQNLKDEMQISCFYSEAFHILIVLRKCEVIFILKFAQSKKNTPLK